jgi:hypothetical protein
MLIIELFSTVSIGLVLILLFAACTFRPESPPVKGLPGDRP